MAKHVTAGEKFRFGARTYNELTSLIEKDRQSSLSMQSKRAGVNTDVVLVKNISGVDVARFGVLGIAGILFDPATALPAFTARTVFTGQTPADVHQAGTFLICAEPIGNGAIGRAWADGIVTVRIDVQDVSHTYATVKPDDTTQLISADQGLCYILYKETGTGTRWAVIRFGGGSGIGRRDRWAYLKEMPTAVDGGVLDGRLDDPATGEIIEIHFTLLNCSGVGEGHLSLTIDTPVRVAKRGDQWCFIGCIEGTGVTVCD
jgi:hypothetical protein